MVLLLLILITIISLILILSGKPKSNSNYKPNIRANNIQENIIKSQNVETINVPDYKKYYRAKRYIMTINELKFYNILLEIAKELDLILFSQVSLYNILETKNNLDYSTRQTYFNKIASKSIDFVLVDKHNCRIKLCIELDDNTHKQEKRKQRDKFINELFKNLEINLLRYPTYQIYYKDTLKRKIQENIVEHYYID